MNPALAFILGAVGLMMAVVSVLILALWRGARAGAAAQATQDATAQANAQVYRDQLAELTRERDNGTLSHDDWQEARDELTRRLLEDVDGATTHAKPAEAASDIPAAPRKPWALTIGLLLLIPLTAMVMYARLGQPMALDPSVVAQGPGETSEVTPEKLSAMATALIRRLQDEPNSIDGWVMLGRVQRARGLFDEADEALSKALTLTQDDDLKIERAEVLAQKSGGRFAGEPWAIIERVLSVDPHHLNALLLAGSASYAELNYRSALRFWERAREVVPADSPDAAALERAMAEAREKMGLPAMPASDATPAASSPVKADTSISGRVSLVNELKGKVAPTDTVLIYATPVTGSRMPVAMLRTTADKLPLDFVLDDSTSMSPSAKLSGQTEVTVRVRISKQAQAVAQPDDFGVSLSPVKPGSRGLNLMVRDTLR